MAGKRGGKRKTSWKRGQSGNPRGAPARDDSWAGIYRHMASLTPVQMADELHSFAEVIRELGSGFSIKEAIAARTLVSQLNEPSAGMLNIIMERMEGRVPQPVEVGWKAEALAMLRQGKLTQEELVEELGDGLAGQLLVEAGLRAARGGEAAGEG